jgi:hypothetical protein
VRRRDTILGALALVAILGAPPLACVDLFHSTTFETACDVDAAACATSPAPPDGGPTDFCLWDTTTARSNALRACAWLGACAGPVGDNALGPCFVRAMLAYNCAVNPNRNLIPGSAAHEVWDRLWQAKSCNEVRGAIFPPNVVPVCGGSATPYATCFPDSGILLSCDGDDSGTTLGVENCAALGQTCATSGDVAACAGSSATCADAGTSCSGTQLMDCDPDAGSFDLGIDCASVGAAACVPGAPAACQAAGNAKCDRSSEVTCSGNVAMGCPSGSPEQVDCNALLPGTGLGNGLCDSSSGGRPWDVSRACTLGACKLGDSCEKAKTISSCARGVVVSIDCTTIGLSGCTTVQLPGDPATYAACVP